MPHICSIGLEVRQNLGHSPTIKHFLDQFKNQCQWSELRHCVVHTFQILDCPPCSFWGYRKETTFSFLILFKVKNVFRWLCRQAREHFHRKSQNYYFMWQTVRWTSRELDRQTDRQNFRLRVMTQISVIHAAWRSKCFWLPYNRTVVAYFYDSY